MNLKPVKHSWSYKDGSYKNSGYVIGKNKKECLESVEVMIKKSIPSDKKIKREKIEIYWRR